MALFGKCLLLLFIVLVHHALRVNAGEECPTYKRSLLSPRTYYISSYKYCSTSCCGTKPDIYCCPNTVVIVGGSVGGGVSVLVVLFLIYCLCCN